MEVQLWSLAKLLDLISHLLIPVMVRHGDHRGHDPGHARTRLDELGKQHVIAAREKGVPPAGARGVHPVHRDGCGPLGLCNVHMCARRSESEPYAG